MEIEETKRYRILTGPMYMVEKGLALIIPLVGLTFVLDLPMLLAGISLFNQQYLGLFLGLVMTMLFIKTPAVKGASVDKIPWYDYLFMVLSLAAGFYVFFFYPKLILAIGVISTQNILIGVAILIALLEGTRRIAGWPLVIIILTFIIYARFGHILPGALGTREVSWGRLITQLYLGSESIYGIALRIAVLVVFSFVFFAHTLFGTGAAGFLFNLAESLMGRFRGGPAKISILASSFFGTLSGSAVANVASTGTITIPLMKKSGYSSHFASAVESVASTGGTITPPVMGAAAFLIAEFVGVPYSQVVLVAIMPAVLYYLGLFVQVDLRAAKDNLKGLPAEKLPSLWQTLLEGWFYLIPMLVMVYGLFVLYLRPEVAALYSVASLVLVTSIRKSTRQGFSAFRKMIENTSQGMLEVTVISAAAGLVIGIVSYTGLGLSLSRILTDLAGGSLLLLAILAAGVSIILGMGVPVTASYLLLAVLVAPAFIKLGVPALVAHMFIFYFGTFSFITPPVCMAVFTAASIGGADVMKTAIQSMKLAIAGFAVPFIFIFNPDVVFIGELIDIIVAVVSAMIAIIALSFAIENYSSKKLTLVKRLIYAVSAVGLLVPSSWIINLIATVILLTLFSFDFLVGKKTFLGRMSTSKKVS